MLCVSGAILKMMYEAALRNFISSKLSTTFGATLKPEAIIRVVCLACAWCVSVSVLSSFPVPSLFSVGVPLARGKRDETVAGAVLLGYVTKLGEALLSSSSYALYDRAALYHRIIVR